MWITRVSINNPVFATMVMVALCVLGLFAYNKLGVEQIPDVSPPIAFVDVAYPGASPEAVEREVTKLVEEALNSIAGVKRITSRSFEGRSQSQVEFNLNANLGRAMQDLRDRMGAIQSLFPKDAKTPTIARFDNDNAQPAVVMALLSKTRSARELSILGDKVVSKRLQRVDGVARVDISGLATREVRIDLDATRLRSYGITPAEISTALNQANSDQPVGLLTDSNQDAILRVEGRVRDPKQFTDIVVGRRAGLPLTLGDLGTLVEREREPDSVARINGQRAVTFNVFKQQDANIVATGEAVKAVHRFSGGTPRLINTLCDNALFEGYVARAPRIDLAMIDAVMLAQTLYEHEELSAALGDYDQRGRAALRQIQAAARTSMAWFERADRYLDRDAVAFAYSMAGRQGAQPPWRYQMHLATQIPAVRAALRGINSGRRWYLARRRGETPALPVGSR